MLRMKLQARIKARGVLIGDPCVFSEVRAYRK